jgi:hypothetical protein
VLGLLPLVVLLRDQKTSTLIKVGVNTSMYTREKLQTTQIDRELVMIPLDKIKYQVESELKF